MLGGAALGASSLDLLSDSIMEGVLSFGGAALLYLVTEELLVEAHKKSETPIQAAMFFVGFIALFLTEMVAK